MTFNVTGIIKHWYGEHLLTLDRKHCTNRVHRLRSTLKMTHGKGRKFEKLPSITPDIVKSGQYVLFSALGLP
jgi:hypothetical protein